MSVQRVEAIIAYGEAIVDCYNNRLSPEERQALQDWEYSDEFTRTDFWPGWAKYIGLSPCAPKAKPTLVRRSA
jgi:hypothetical protein